MLENYGNRKTEILFPALGGGGGEGFREVPGDRKGSRAPFRLRGRVAVANWSPSVPK